jgi:hypothetical protein
MGPSHKRGYTQKVRSRAKAARRYTYKYIYINNVSDPVRYLLMQFVVFIKNDNTPGYGFIL